MTWTTDPPAVPGLYWWAKGGLATVVRVIVMGVTDAHTLGVEAGSLGVIFHGTDTPVLPAYQGGEWWGPLVPPGDGGAVVSDSDRGPATADGEPWKGV